jgi:hypothetical protein
MIFICNFSLKYFTWIAFLVWGFPDLFELVIINLKQLSTQMQEIYKSFDINQRWSINISLLVTLVQDYRFEKRILLNIKCIYCKVEQHSYSWSSVRADIINDDDYNINELFHMHRRIKISLANELAPRPNVNGKTFFL